jgi:hypothetical protein
MPEIARAHRDAAAELKVEVAPVGLAWERARQQRSSLNLYGPDREHPSVHGTWVVAAVLRPRDMAPIACRGGAMQYRHAPIIGILAVALGLVACNRDAAESQKANAEVSRDAARTADLQRQHDEDITRLDERVAKLERDYAETNQKVVSGSRTATAGLREELKEDVANVKSAVNDLRSTTPENWWNRHETAVRRTADDIEQDVTRLAGAVTPRRPDDATGTTGEGVSTAPFTSRRDQFVANLRARVEAMEDALEKVKASGARETEINDTRARLTKLAGDLDRLGSASADDWWDVTKTRVTEYVDRVEASVERLDDNKK